jgi:hypothetical protein
VSEPASTLTTPCDTITPEALAPVIEPPARTASASAPPLELEVPGSVASLPNVGSVMSVGLRPAAARATMVSVGDGAAEAETPSGAPLLVTKLLSVDASCDGRPLAVWLSVPGPTVP